MRTQSNTKSGAVQTDGCMKTLIYKEFKLAMHPTLLIFLSFVFMLLIPDYPYLVAYFYLTLAIFFVCITGRENHDIEYMLLLPVRKRDVVRSRIAFSTMMEAAMVLLSLPFVFIRTRLGVPNAVGMDANAALLGCALIMFGLFNLVFFVNYYKNPLKIGGKFLIASSITFVFMAVEEVSCHVVPFMRDCADTTDPANLGARLAVLMVGIAIFALCTYVACRKSEKTFEALDI